MARRSIWKHPLYHGTDAKNLSRILKEGLRGREGEGNWPDNPSFEGLTYLSDWLPMYYAKGDRELAILQVEPEGRGLYPDEDFLRMAGLDKSEDPRNYRHIHFQKGGVALGYKESLTQLGTCASEPIPPGRIVAHMTVPFDVSLWIFLGGDTTVSRIAHRIKGEEYRTRLGLLFSDGLDAVKAAMAEEHRKLQEMAQTLKAAKAAGLGE